jgi:hypothetical protein
MPLFTVESTYRLPIYRHRTYEAPTAAEACRLAINDDDWSDTKEDRDSAGETHVTGVWKGRDSAYRAPPCPVPSQFQETLRRKADHFAEMLVLLQHLPHHDEPSLRADLLDRIARAITKADAVQAGAADPVGQLVPVERQRSEGTE